MLTSLLELARAAVGYWASWAFLFGVAFILVFRRPITELIGRLTRIGRGNWAAEAQEAKPEQTAPQPIAGNLTQAPEQKADPRTAADELIAQVSRNEYVKSREDNLKKALSDRGLVPTSPETVRALITLTASVFVSAEFEALYGTIWTGQIHVLRQANSGPGLTSDQLRVYYDAGARVRPDAYKDYGFESYVKFLIGQSLLVETAPGKYAITVKGRTFLLYLTHQGKPEVRPIY
jgi:hypothetical protein